ncbi:MAG TPA: carboxylesterase [Gammaproteobacteria bacterium]|nr:carboxylesterase [Gammaproteobacteria bacterium]
MAGHGEGADLEYLDLAPAGPADRAVVWLHGLGADGHDFEPLFRGAAGLPAGTRVLLPHAPRRPVTVNGGMTMRAWYDIASPDLTGDADIAGIERSAERIGALLGELEAGGLPAERIVLGGFSQGGVLALWTGLGYPRPLAGVAALSAYLPGDPPLAPAQRETPVFQGHGRHDSLIPFALGEAARERLPALGAPPPEWHEYAMDHGVCDAEVADLLAWLGRVLG